jgi:hypothetical protein
VCVGAVVAHGVNAYEASFVCQIAAFETLSLMNRCVVRHPAAVYVKAKTIVRAVTVETVGDGVVVASLAGDC